MKKHCFPIAVLIAFAFLIVTGFTTPPKAPTTEYYLLTVYHMKNAEQLAATNAYLKNSYLPSLHKTGLKNIGVFSSIDNDTAADKKVYLLIPFTSLQKFEALMNTLSNETFLKNDTSAYTNAAFNNAPYVRMETTLLKAFKDMPNLKRPVLSAPLSERVYELRSYEGATEKLYRKKVNMFNEGGEVNLFNQLKFNAVFYAEVLTGAHMPNLMYMTSFENKAARDEHWKAFSADATWKRISTMPEYLNTVSKADISFLRPTDYSDY